MTIRSKRRRSRRGFTLMEILLVLVILVILFSISGVMLRNVRKKALIDSARAQIGVFVDVMSMYEMHMSTYPSTSEGLEVLRTPPSDNSGNYGGPYLEKEIPADPWGNAYQYELSSDGETFQIWSMGPDKTSNTDDDIIN